MVLNKVESERNSRLTSDYDGEIVMVDRKGNFVCLGRIGMGRMDGRTDTRKDSVAARPCGPNQE
jgi:hypothetical protein